MNVCRGDIFIVRNYVRVSGSEQAADRPAVIVSNNIGNEHSEICEVVYLTTKEKKPLPTHVSVLARVPSTALCEQIHTISQDRLCEYIRSCTDEEMTDIDNALMVSIGLGNTPDPTATVENATIADLSELVDRLNEQNDNLLMKLEWAERKNDELNAKNAGLLLDNGDLKERLKEAENNTPSVSHEFAREVVRTEAERDFYKQQYEMLLERMIAR